MKRKRNRHESKQLRSKLNKWIKLLSNDRDWDFIDMFYIEELKLQYMYQCFQEIGNKQISRDLRICLRLLHILQDKDNSYNYVNIRNYKRFTSYKPVFGLEEYRQLKALYLYNKIRTYKIWSWWD